MTSLVMESGISADMSCRDVTREEIAHFQAHGWAKLDRLVDYGPEAGTMSVSD